MNSPDAFEVTPFKRLDDEPLFDEPWQAQLLAMLDSLIGEGLFEAVAWSEALGEALQQAQARGEPDTMDTYYAAVLQTMERLLDRAGNLSASEVANRRDAWAQAYSDTPHGKPVHLKGRENQESES